MTGHIEKLSGSCLYIFGSHPIRSTHLRQSFSINQVLVPDSDLYWHGLFEHGSTIVSAPVSTYSAVLAHATYHEEPAVWCKSFRIVVALFNAVSQ